MNLSYQEEYYSKSSSEETDQNDDTAGSGSRSYECIFCKRGFTTAQALGGHMNIHRKDKLANKNRPTFPLISSSELRSHPTLGLGGNNNYYSAVADEVDANNNYRQVYNFPETTCGIRPSRSHVGYSDDVLCVENQQDHHHLFGQDWRQRNLNLYTNPFCAGEIKDKFEDSEEDGLDLELRLGRQP